VSLLNENKINYTIVEYLKNPLGVDDVLLLSKKLGMDPGEFVRKNEKDFKENKLEKMIYDNNKMVNKQIWYYENKTFIFSDERTFGELKLISF